MVSFEGSIITPNEVNNDFLHGLKGVPEKEGSGRTRNGNYQYSDLVEVTEGLSLIYGNLSNKDYVIF